MVVDNNYEKGVPLDSFSVWDIAVLAFSSPAEIKDNVGKAITLTSKESYVWAGAIAYIVSENPSINIEKFMNELRGSLIDFSSELERLATDFRYSVTNEGIEVRIIQNLLKRFGNEQEILESILRYTDVAQRKLEFLGLIEDPFRKKFLGIVMGVIAVMPISFTSKTDKGAETERRIKALTWEYVQHNDGKDTDYHVKLKVKQIADLVVNDLIPTVVSVISKLSQESTSQEKIEFLISQGINDPDVLLFHAVLKGDVNGVQNAINKGANLNITDTEIFIRYKDVLSKME